MRVLHSTGEVIDALKGPTKMGRHLGGRYAPARVCNWRRTGFPIGTFDEIQAALAGIDCIADPDLWPDMPETVKAQIKSAA